MSHAIYFGECRASALLYRLEKERARAVDLWSLWSYVPFVEADTGCKNEKGFAVGGKAKENKAKQTSNQRNYCPLA
jgi:hypothetical protein